MPGLDSIIGLSSTAEQLFVWGVLQQVIGELIKPYLQALDNIVLSANPNVPLTPAFLAGAVVRGHIDESSAAAIAKKSGIPESDFHLMIESYGNPPGPQALAEALRRGFIPEGQAGDENPSFRGGISQGDLQNKWADVIQQLDLRLPTPTAVITAYIRSMLDESTAKELYQRYGGDPSGFQLEANITGEGPSPVEAGVLLNRGIIPEHGSGPDATSFDQAVAESRFKNKWAFAYAALREYRPPPRTITAMFREGSLTAELATQYLQDYGVTPQEIPLYVNNTIHQRVATAHSITEGEIIKLYGEKGISEAEAKQALKSIGYTDVDADHILAAEDLAYHSRLTTTWTSVLKTEFLRYHISDNDVVTRLDSLGVAAAYRDSLLEQWQIERRYGVKQLTAKQILDLFGSQLLNAQQATSKLQEIGYSAIDAGLLVALNDPNTVPGSGSIAGLSNPGT